MGFFEDDDGINSQFGQRRIDGTDFYVRVDSPEEMDKSIQREMNGEMPINMGVEK